MFASEVLFQGGTFSLEAHGQSFGIKVPMDLAPKYGASHYSTFRRYVVTNPHICCVAVLYPPVYDKDDRYRAEVRRVVASKSFEKIYDSKSLCAPVTEGHPLLGAVPVR